MAVKTKNPPAGTGGLGDEVNSLNDTSECNRRRPKSPAKNYERFPRPNIKFRGRLTRALRAEPRQTAKSSQPTEIVDRNRQRQLRSIEAAVPSAKEREPEPRPITLPVVGWLLRPAPWAEDRR
jgi:hypothetical protein